MKDMDIDTDLVSRCIQSSASTKLKDQRENVAWSPQAVRVNGWRYSGPLEPDTVTRAVCSGFVIVPKECAENPLVCTGTTPLARGWDPGSEVLLYVMPAGRK